MERTQGFVRLMNETQGMSDKRFEEWLKSLSLDELDDVVNATEYIAKQAVKEMGNKAKSENPKVEDEKVGKFCCHCIVHLHDGISTLVQRPTIVVEAKDELEARKKVRKDLENKYKYRNDVGLSSVLFELIKEIS